MVAWVNGMHSFTPGRGVRSWRQGCLALLLGVLGSFTVRAQQDFLSEEERAWLTEHEGQILIGSDSNYQPYITIDENGRISGVWGDIILRVEQELGVEFTVKEYPTFSSVLEAMKAREIHIVPSLIATEERGGLLSALGLAEDFAKPARLK